MRSGYVAGFESDPPASVSMAMLDEITNDIDLPPGLPADRLMIRVADLGVEVARADDAIARCQEAVAAHGGYVSRRDGASLVCRIPAPRFDVFVAEVRALGRVLRESMQAMDVTEQHRDLTIRLDNARKSRDRLLALLEKADQVEDLLKIETELRRLTEEIEQMTAQLQNLDNRVALATVNVQFTAAEPADRPTRRRPSRFDWVNAVGAEHVLRTF